MAVGFSVSSVPSLLPLWLKSGEAEKRRKSILNFELIRFIRFTVSAAGGSVFHWLMEKRGRGEEGKTAQKLRSSEAQRRK